MEGQRVTIYVSGEFTGRIVRHVGKLVDVRWHSDKRESVTVKFVPYRKRRTYEITKSSTPYLIVIAGEGPPVPDVKSEATPDGIVRRYRFGDDSHRITFDRIIDGWLDKNPGRMVFDSRLVTKEPQTHVVA